ncbi:MAG: hypothetical protein MUE59_02700 [Thiobacillaceae bacterium]|jgi:hypothetical protein|nr:hypothetical protein [Thiobacillaceae bacterium]
MQNQTATETAAPTRAPILPGKRLATFDQAAAQYLAFSAAALRDMKFRAFDRTNSRGEVIKGNGTGAAGVWLQIGRKVLIDLDAFDAWLDAQRVAK